MHDPNQPCEQFCTNPIGPDGEPGGDDWKAQCPECVAALTVLCRDVLPAIRKHGYWSPTGATLEEELGHMRYCEGRREHLRDTMADLVGEEIANTIFGGAS